MIESKGKVYIIGVGPGDPALLTVKGQEILRRADTIITHYTINRIFLQNTRTDVTIIYQNALETNVSTLLVELVRQGKCVAWLKTGDPFVFGNLNQELEALAESETAFEIVPGVSSAVAVPAYAGIPITYANLSQSFTVIGDDKDPVRLAGIDWQKLVKSEETLIFLTDDYQIGQIANHLLQAGMPFEMPVAVIAGGTTWQQTSWAGTLDEVGVYIAGLEVRPKDLEKDEIEPPALLVLGEVVKLRQKLRWWDTPEARPLLGKRIVVTRAREQAGTFSARLTELGANAIEFPTIKIIEPEDYAPMDAAIMRLEDFDWVVFTSVNGVEYFMNRLKLLGKDARAFGKARVCAIGPATAAALEDCNIRADFVPSKYVAESILEELGEVAGKKILLARADVAREVLIEGLTEKGAEVENVIAYRQIIGGEDGPTTTGAAELVKLLEAGAVDVVAFTSSNTVRNFGKRLATVSNKPLPELLQKTLVACIGPITAGAARELNLRVDLEASEFTIDKLIEAMIAAYRPEAVGAK